MGVPTHAAPLSPPLLAPNNNHRPLNHTRPTMPKSKRERVVSLSAVRKTPQAEVKERLIEDVTSCADSFDRVYVVTVHNMRNSLLKEARAELGKSSRFFFGRNAVIKVALGRDEEYVHVSTGRGRERERERQE